MPELAAAIVESDPDLSRDEADGYIGELVESQSDVAPPITGDEPVRGILETLPPPQAARSRLRSWTGSSCPRIRPRRRQQLIVAQRKIVGRVRWAPWQRFTMGIAVRFLPAWRAAALLVQPATLLRWHRVGFRVFWRRRSRPGGRPPNANASLIRDMASKKNRIEAVPVLGGLHHDYRRAA